MITDKPRKFWEEVMALGKVDGLVLRDYDILKDRAAGKGLQQIADKYCLSLRSLYRVLHKHGKM
jgi:Mor family transcriptional regulator